MNSLRFSTNLLFSGFERGDGIGVPVLGSEGGDDGFLGEFGRGLIRRGLLIRGRGGGVGDGGDLGESGGGGCGLRNEVGLGCGCLLVHNPQTHVGNPQPVKWRQ